MYVSAAEKCHVLRPFVRLVRPAEEAHPVLDAECGLNEVDQVDEDFPEEVGVSRGSLAVQNSC